MGLLTRFSSLFGAKQSPTSSAANAFRPAAPAPANPVDIDISPRNDDAFRDEDPIGLQDEPKRSHGSGMVAIQTPAPPKSKGEMIAELQKNYSEVMDLIRKVSNHLDEQADRSARLMEIAERIPEALDALPEIRSQNEQILVALREAAEAARSRDDRSAQTLDRLHDRLEEARESDRVLVGTMAEFRGTLREMADTSERTGATLADMSHRSAVREQELNNILLLTRRWITIATVVGLLLVMVATAGVIMIAVRG